jgi:hypothetical protein
MIPRPVIKRLYIDNSRRITFIFGAPATVVAFKGDQHGKLKMTITEALQLFNEFVARGAKEIR